MAASVLGAVAVGRLQAGGPWTAHTVPLVVTATVGAAVPVALLRSGAGRRLRATRRGAIGRAAPLLAAPLGLVAVLLVATWTTVGGATVAGAPTATTLRVLRHQLAAARAALHGLHLPVAPRPGVEFLAAVVVGLAAVAARLLLAGPEATAAADRADTAERGEPAAPERRWPLAAMLPSTALVAWSAAVVGGTGAEVLAAIAAGLAAAGVLADHGPTTATDPVTADGRRATAGLGERARRGAPGWSLTLAAIGAAVVLAAVVGPSVPGGSALADQRARGGGARSGPERAPVPPTAVSLATDLLGVESRDPTVPLFIATSPIPTYWQVATLTRFESGRWSADPATLSALRSGTVPPEPNLLPGAGRATFVARVTLDRFSSRLLPVAPDTLQVSLAGRVTVTGAGAVAPTPLPAGATYQLTGAVPPTVGAAAPPGAGPASSPQATPPGDLSVPGLPGAVRRLAETVTAGATSPLARAEALEDWFRSGRFRYHLALPSRGDLARPGAAMVRFLEHTREGSCQDFAGAYAAMARAVGLPARVAVGFTAGRRLAPTARTPAGFVASLVRGTDAHAWPEVYLGADLGWVSFEPTPERPAGQLAPEGIVGPSGRSTNPVGPPVTTPTTPSTAPPVPQTAPAATRPTTTPVTAASGGGSGRHAPRSSSGAASATATAGLAALGWAAIAVAALILLLLLALSVLPILVSGVSFPAERRRRRLVRTEPSLAVVDAYRSAQRSLAPVGLAALPTEPPVVHAGRLLAAAEPIGEAAAGLTSAATAAPADRSDADQLTGALRDAAALAHAVELVCFAAVPATAEQATDGYRRTTRIRRTLRRRGVRSLARDLSARLPPPPGPPQSPRTRRSTSPV
ncbi:MAG: transglutaminase-like domain-containing protein [Acidimicrobiales bacterium]